MKTITVKFPTGEEFDLQVNDQEYARIQEYARVTQTTFAAAAEEIIKIGLDKVIDELWTRSRARNSTA